MMKQRTLFFGLVLLAMLHTMALAQSKAKADNPVTVTLVRWPYT